MNLGYVSCVMSRKLFVEIWNLVRTGTGTEGVGWRWLTSHFPAADKRRLPYPCQCDLVFYTKDKSVIFIAKMKSDDPKLDRLAKPRSSLPTFVLWGR